MFLFLFLFFWFHVLIDNDWSAIGIYEHVEPSRSRWAIDQPTYTKSTDSPSVGVDVSNGGLLYVIHYPSKW